MAQRTRVSFEVERLALEGDELVISGVWTGVRGMRFVRPTLLSEDRRILATLEHKPWAPSENAPWTVAFPWAGGIAVDADTLSIAVAPKVIVPLGESTTGTPAAADPAPAPDSARARQPTVAAEVTPATAAKPTPKAMPAAKPTPVPAAKPKPVPAAKPTPVPAAPADPPPSDPASNGTSVLGSPIIPLDPRIDDLTRALAAAERERDRALTQLAEATETRDAAIRTRARMEIAHDEAVQAREVAETAAAKAEAERQEAVVRRDEVLLVYRTLQRRVQTERAQADRVARRKPDESSADDEPLGVRTVPAVRSVMAELQYPPREPKRRLATFDLWVVRVVGLAAAGCFLLLLISILRVFM